MSAKINIIAAISNFGECWYALLTCPIDGQIFRLFILQLSNLLETQDPVWRTRTVFLIDGVSFEASFAHVFTFLGLVSCLKYDARVLLQSWSENSHQRSLQLRSCTDRILVWCTQIWRL